MYSRFCELKITKRTFYITYKDTFTAIQFTLLPNEPDFRIIRNESIKFYGDNGYTLLVDHANKNIKITKDCNEIENIFLGKEMTYYINKDIEKHGEFSLDYRKHLQKKYTKTVNIEFNPATLFEDVPEVIEKQIHRVSCEFQGLSGGKHDPVVLVIGFSDGEYPWICLYKGKVVKSGIFSLEDSR